MLDWWLDANIYHVDLMVKRPGDATILHANVPINIIPLPWLRAENARGADIYIRPERNLSWPLLFLDDVNPEMAKKIASKYALLIVRTSIQGGCHLWLKTTTPLDEDERGKAQRFLSQRVQSDRASASGEHFGRLAGMKNWKRGGVWVNVVHAVSTACIPWNPAQALNSSEIQITARKIQTIHAPKSNVYPGKSESEREWGWVCSAIEAGISPERILKRLIQRATFRRGADAERYAKRTVEQAVKKCG